MEKKDGKNPSPGGRRTKDEGVLSWPDYEKRQQLLEHAAKMRKSQTDAEGLLWGILRGRRFLGLKFRRQHTINGFIVDFYCNERRLAIELDGGGHNDSAKERSDFLRTESLRKNGIRVIRFWNNDVFNNIEAVLEKFFEELKD
ncbi:MAG TPA: endonuclease domain-containing protein [Caldisericia bacterium]|nr:endonuclease domain-containing protein [Caldisericia bacterium]